jgi:hypothetical protein
VKPAAASPAAARACVPASERIGALDPEVLLLAEYEVQTRTWQKVQSLRGDLSVCRLPDTDNVRARVADPRG